MGNEAEIDFRADQEHGQQAHINERYRRGFLEYSRDRGFNPDRGHSSSGAAAALNKVSREPHRVVGFKILCRSCTARGRPC
jgi:hypothetical protein